MFRRTLEGELGGLDGHRLEAHVDVGVLVGDRLDHVVQQIVSNTEYPNQYST